MQLLEGQFSASSLAALSIGIAIILFGGASAGTLARLRAQVFCAARLPPPFPPPQAAEG